MLKMKSKDLIKICFCLTVICPWILLLSCFANGDQTDSPESPNYLQTNHQNKGLIGMSLPAEFRPFSNDSPWNTAIPKNPELDLYSDLMVKHLKSKARILKGDMKKWTVPVFVINSDLCPQHKIRTTSSHLNPELDPDGDNISIDIPIPEGVWPDPERDGHMVLIDLKKMKSWDLSIVKRLPDASWIASRIDIWDLNGSGFRKPFTGKYWWTYGARGSGFPLIAGLIRPEEIEVGKIRHALVFASPINRKYPFPAGRLQLCSPPASRTDGYGVGFEYIPEGARMQLDPDLDLSKLNISASTKVIARAMQEYGMYNGDNARTFKIYFQNLGPDGGVWKKYNFFDDLKNIPIDRFRVLKGNLISKS